MNGNDTPDLGTQTTAGDTAARSPNMLARFLALFSSPSRAFVAPRTLSLWLVPVVVMSLVQITEGVLTRDLIKQKMIATFSRNEKIPEEQREKLIADMEDATQDPAKLALQQVGGAAANILFVYLVPSLLYLLGLNFVLGGRARFRDVFTVTMFSGLVLIPRELIRTPLMLAKGTMDVYLSPAALVSGENLPLVVALNLFDVFQLYQLFVIAVGLAVATGLPVRKTLFPVVAVWLLYGLIGVGCMLSPLGQFMR